eukprot:CAMPEP_0177685854 /NCGR_PEP_ID=MMETSP0447-20121125/33256_1 /TAXON_ID=0 /ORGANISM="Stygamoeba regulata, Strain BSH-02190019" /LENGTH=613 /DNA_ID=CAMNT_0019195935 /DNA_START=11 /DNA_END=1852 /DNA_ORIENTATION=-
MKSILDGAVRATIETYDDDQHHKAHMYLQRVRKMLTDTSMGDDKNLVSLAKSDCSWKFILSDIALPVGLRNVLRHEILRAAGMSTLSLKNPYIPCEETSRGLGEIWSTLQQKFVGFIERICDGTSNLLQILLIKQLGPIPEVEGFGDGDIIGPSHRDGDGVKPEDCVDLMDCLFTAVSGKEGGDSLLKKFEEVKSKKGKKCEKMAAASIHSAPVAPSAPPKKTTARALPSNSDDAVATRDLVMISVPVKVSYDSLINWHDTEDKRGPKNNVPLILKMISYLPQGETMIKDVLKKSAGKDHIEIESDYSSFIHSIMDFFFPESSDSNNSESGGSDNNSSTKKSSGSTKTPDIMESDEKEDVSFQDTDKAVQDSYNDFHTRLGDIMLERSQRMRAKGAQRGVAGEDTDGMIGDRGVKSWYTKFKDGIKTNRHKRTLLGNMAALFDAVGNSATFNKIIDIMWKAITKVLRLEIIDKNPIVWFCVAVVQVLTLSVASYVAYVALCDLFPQWFTLACTNIGCTAGSYVNYALVVVKDFFFTAVGAREKISVALLVFNLFYYMGIYILLVVAVLTWWDLYENWQRTRDWIIGAMKAVVNGAIDLVLRLIPGARTVLKRT